MIARFGCSQGLPLALLFNHFFEDLGPVDFFLWVPMCSHEYRIQGSSAILVSVCMGYRFESKREYKS